MTLVGGLDRAHFRASVVLFEPKALEADLRALAPPCTSSDRCRRASAGSAISCGASVPTSSTWERLQQEWKGQLLVLDAVARGRRSFPQLRCLLVGGVHDMGAEYAARVRARAAEPDLAGHVVLTGERRDIPACFDAMDVVLHASTRPEPFGRVLIEAMAASRPVIAPREGGPLAIVADGETGLLVPPRDPAALADAIVALLGDAQRRLAMGRAARACAETSFSVEGYVAAVSAVPDEALARQSPATCRTPDDRAVLP